MVRAWSVAVVIGVGVLAGCEKKEEAPSPAPPPQQQSQTPDVKTIDGVTAQAAQAADAAKAEAAKITREAEDGIAQVWQLIKDKKYDIAETTLKALESRKASLPQAIQDNLVQVRKALDAAKAGAIKIPGLTQ